MVATSTLLIPLGMPLLGGWTVAVWPVSRVMAVSWVALTLLFGSMAVRRCVPLASGRGPATQKRRSSRFAAPWRWLSRRSPGWADRLKRPMWPRFFDMVEGRLIQ